jgi:WD40 repeat protein
MTGSHFTIGGAVQAGGGVYIERAADFELLELCRAGTYAYVLAPRQMGKSSLMIHTIGQLTAEGVRSVLIDLQTLGSETSADQWYAGLLAIISGNLGIETDALGWWSSRDHMSYAARLTEFLRNVVLREVAERIVLFVDEVDMTLGLPFADDFFGAIRGLYDARAQTPDLARLSFVLIGVASPSELVRDPRRTPFNIGRAVAMTDFTLEEAAPLTRRFNAPRQEALRVLAYVLRWTHGHPYLTQRMCRALADNPGDWSEAGVKALAQHIFLGEEGANDPNLQEIKRMLTQRAADPYAVLTTYRTILLAKRSQADVPSNPLWSLFTLGHDRKLADDAQSVVKTLLKLSGIVRSERSRLVVRNPIYRAVFDEYWVSKQLREVKPPEGYWLRRVQITLFWMAVILLLGLIPVSLFAWAQRGQAIRAQQTAVSAQQTAVSAQQIAVADRAVAEAGALALRAQAIGTEDPQQAKRLLLSAAESGQTPQVDQVMRQLVDTERCTTVDAPLYGATWTAGEPDVLVGAGNTQRAMAQLPGQSLDIRQLSDTGASHALLSPDGRFVLLANDQSSRVLSAADGKQLFALPASHAATQRAAWSPDNQRLATLESDTTARLWDARTGAPLFALPELRASISGIAWSADSRQIAIGSADGRIYVWTVEGQPQAIMAGHAAAVDALSWSPDGRQLATASRDGTARVWDVGAGKQALPAFDAHSGPLQAISWSPSVSQRSGDPQYVLTVGADDKVRVWNVATQAQISVLDIGSPIATAAWSPDGMQLLVAESNGRVCIHDTFTRLLQTMQSQGIIPLSPEEKQQELSELLPVPAALATLPAESSTPSPPPSSPPPTAVAPTIDTVAEATVAPEPPVEPFIATSPPKIVELPVATITDTPTATPTETSTPSPTHTPSPTITVTLPSVTDRPSPTSTITESQEVTITPSEGAINTPTAEMIATATGAPQTTQPTDTATPEIAETATTSASSDAAPAGNTAVSAPTEAEAPAATDAQPDTTAEAPLEPVEPTAQPAAPGEPTASPEPAE